MPSFCKVPPNQNGNLSVKQPPPVPDSPRPSSNYHMYEYPTVNGLKNQDQETYTDIIPGTNAKNSMYTDLTAGENSTKDMYVQMSDGQNTGKKADNAYADLPLESFTGVIDENQYAPLNFNDGTNDEYIDMTKK